MMHAAKPDTLLDRGTAMAQLQVSKATFDRWIRSGQLPIAARINRGFGKLSPMFDPEVVEAFARRRQVAKSESHSTPQIPPPPAEALPLPLRATHAQLVRAVKAVHSAQVVILEALTGHTTIEIGVELWHILLDLTRSQERILAEVLLGTPVAVEAEAEMEQ